MTEPLDTRELVRELAGNRCQCGLTKNKGQTFCRHCYFKLPRDICLTLYRRIGEGYEEAYQAAISRLGPSE